jgi:hypothetical protein
MKKKKRKIKRIRAKRMVYPKDRKRLVTMLRLLRSQFLSAREEIIKMREDLRRGKDRYGSIPRRKSKGKVHALNRHQQH